LQFIADKNSDVKHHKVKVIKHVLKATSLPVQYAHSSPTLWLINKQMVF